MINIIKNNFQIYPFYLLLVYIFISLAALTFTNIFILYTWGFFYVKYSLILVFLIFILVMFFWPKYIIYNFNFNKLYPNLLKADNKILSVFAIASIGDFNYKNLSLYNSNNLLHSIISNLSIDKFKFKIKISLNSTFTRENSNSLINNEPNINIDYDLINKIDSNIIDFTKYNINYNFTDKINTNSIGQEIIKYMNLENKLPLISNISIDYLHNNIYTPIVSILINYPHYCAIPLIILIVSFILPLVTCPNSNNTSNITNEAFTETVGTNYYNNSNAFSTGSENSYNNTTGGGNGGEDPFKGKQVFFLLRDRALLKIPYKLYKEFVVCVKKFFLIKKFLIKNFKALTDRLRSLISVNKISIETFLRDTEYIRERVHTLIQNLIDIQTRLGHYIQVLWESPDITFMTCHILTIELYRNSTNWIIGKIINNSLINISSFEMTYYSNDQCIEEDITNNLGNIFNIVEDDCDPFKITSYDVDTLPFFDTHSLCTVDYLVNDLPIMFEILRMFIFN